MTKITIICKNGGKCYDSPDWEQNRGDSEIESSKDASIDGRVARLKPRSVSVDYCKNLHFHSNRATF